MVEANFFEANERDVHFVLLEQLDCDILLQTDKFKEYTLEDVKMILREAYRFAKNEMGPTNVPGDREGCTLEPNGEVLVPESFHKVWRGLSDGGWLGASGDPEWGGQGMPGFILKAVLEFFSGSNGSITDVMEMSTGAASLIESFGTDPQKQKILRNMYEGKWAGTLCMTEPGAGSDVGATSASAIQNGAYYLVQGTKNFITGGEHNLTENIVHIVVARIKGAPEGTRGLSLFIVPKVWIQDDGTLGDANDVVCGGIEHKMGRNASPTCVLNFGENGTCKGLLLGDEHQGMRMVFHMLNDTRMETAIAGLGVASSAYLNALKYAKERIQGVEFAKRGQPEPERVPILRHEDVRRMLLTMKCLVEGVRAIISYSSINADLAKATDDPEKASFYHGIVDILTPVCKAYGTEAAFYVSDLAIQTLGGYGYIKEYPVEQYMRDLKVLTIFEGTNYIQSMDLVGRKLRHQGGQLFSNLMGEIDRFVSTMPSSDRLGHEIAALKKAKEALTASTNCLSEFWTDDKIRCLPLYSTRYLEMMGAVVTGWLLLDQARIALKKLPSIPEGHSDRWFYRGKVYGAKFFVHNILPDVHTKALLLQAPDQSALEIPEEAL